MLNLRMGGQVSSTLSLRAALIERGIDAELLLPRRAGSGSKNDLTQYTNLSFVRRAIDSLELLRDLRGLAAGASVVLHLMLPSPAFLPLLSVIPFPAERMVVQYEGPCTQADEEHVRACLDDPGFILPRLFFNNRNWMRLGRNTRCAHLASHPLIATQLRDAGETWIVEAPNIALFTEKDAACPEFEDLGICEGRTNVARSIWCAYVGHAHPIKGVDDLVLAFARARIQRPELRLLLALSGDGYSGRIRRLVRSHNLTEFVRFVGLVSVPKLLNEVDVLVLPYRSTISTTLYPSLLLEADMARCPVLMAELSLLAPIFNRDSPGMRTFAPGSVTSLATALRGTRTRRAHEWKPLLRLPSVEECVDRIVETYSAQIRGERARRLSSS